MSDDFDGERLQVGALARRSVPASRRRKPQPSTSWVWRGLLVITALLATPGCVATKHVSAHINPSGTGISFLTLAASGSVVGDYVVVVKGLDDTSTSQTARVAALHRVRIEVTISVSTGHYQYAVGSFKYNPAGGSKNAPAIPADTTNSSDSLPPTGTLDAGQSVTGIVTFDASPDHGEIEFYDPRNPHPAGIWNAT